MDLPLARHARLVLCGALCALAATGLAVTPARAGANNRFFGVKAWNFNPSAAEFARMGAARIGTYRVDMLWAGVEPTAGQRIWREYDQIAANASRAGMTVLPTLLSSPPFISPIVQYPPRSGQARTAWLAFVTDAVRRYGRGGEFWHQNPDVPYRPITAWQVWNEPNYPAYWFLHPRAREYASLLTVTAKAIRAVDPHARVVMAGLPESKNGIPVAKYLRALYRVRGIRRAFDVVAIHPYARGPAGVEGAIRRVRAIMNSHHDARKPIWLTEIGWASGGPRNPFVTTKRGQASRLSRTLRLLARIRHHYRLGMVVWFSWRDRPFFPGEHRWWAPYTGLFDRRGRPKPAWRALVRITRGRAGRGALASPPQAPSSGLTGPPPPSAQ